MEKFKRVLSVFGDNKLPQQTSKYGKNKYKLSVENIINFLREAKPDKIYIIPDTETTIITAICCEKLGIKTVLVSPYPGFFNNLPKREKLLLMVIAKKINNFVLLAEKSDTIDNTILLLKDTVNFCLSVSNGIAFFRSINTHDSFENFMEKVSNSKTDKTYFELIYDTREFFFKQI